jgi:UDP-2-acetamido-3-amino-2,3-dideoxy-glucuronate N-acetyltransferase
VAGGGYWGRNLVRNFAELGVLHTICDSNPQTIVQFNEIYPDINKESDYTRLLANPQIEAVVISTPAALHFSMARQALEAGKDVFVEKPLSLTVAEGEQLVKLAESRGRLLMVGHLLEYHPAVVKLKKIVDAGELGKINYIYSSRLNLGKLRTEENILWSFAPHDISAILLLLGEMPLQVSAYGGQYLNREIEDIAVTNLTFSRGVKAHIFVSWLHPYKEQRLVVIGDKKMAVFDDTKPADKLIVYDNHVEWQNRLPVPVKGEALPIEFDAAEPLKLECQHFVECVASRQKPRTDGTKGLQVLRVLAACQQSFREHDSGTSPDASPYFVHPTSFVDKPVQIGEGTHIWHFCHVMPGASIGRNCNIGQNVYVASGVNIGNNVKIQNNVSVYEGVTLEDDVFCGPSCVFTNVKVPRSHRPQRGQYWKTLVKTGTTIGANSTIVCGTTLGRYSFIGAGALVSRDVPDHALVYGNPARIMGWLCKCGEKLEFDAAGKAICSACGKAYEKTGERKIAERTEK